MIQKRGEFNVYMRWGSRHVGLLAHHTTKHYRQSLSISLRVREKHIHTRNTDYSMRHDKYASLHFSAIISINKLY